MTTDPLATLAGADTIGANPIAIIIGTKFVFLVLSVTYYALVRSYFIFYFIRHVITPSRC